VRPSLSRLRPRHRSRVPLPSYPPRHLHRKPRHTLREGHNYEGRLRSPLRSQPFAQHRLPQGLSPSHAWNCTKAKFRCPLHLTHLPRHRPPPPSGH
jgi:hypothetical protein